MLTWYIDATLKELKKAVVADGHLSEKDIELFRETLFNDKGMTREKANFIFNLIKDAS